MKANYFQQDAPDADDGVLKKMVSEGVVPSTCLWGGLMVQHVRSTKDDPCAFCDGPRTRCHGRAKREAPQPSAPVEHVSDSEHGARKLQRAGYIVTLRRMMEGRDE